MKIELSHCNDGSGLTGKLRKSPPANESSTQHFEVERPKHKMSDKHSLDIHQIIGYFCCMLHHGFNLHHSILWTDSQWCWLTDSPVASQLPQNFARPTRVTLTNECLERDIPLLYISACKYTGTQKNIDHVEFKWMTISTSQWYFLCDQKPLFCNNPPSYLQLLTWMNKSLFLGGWSTHPPPMYPTRK